MIVDYRKKEKGFFFFLKGVFTNSKLNKNHNICNEERILFEFVNSITGKIAKKNLETFRFRDFFLIDYFINLLK